MRLKLRYDPHHDFYQTIGVELTADAETIQRAYRQKAKELHPDRNPERLEWATEQFQRLTEAYSVLSDAELRSQYNDLRWAYLTRRGFATVATPPRTRPSYSPPKRYTPYPGYKSPIKRGAWLEKSGIGWLRPFYAGFVDLLTGPYRYVILLLGVVLVINGLLIFSGFFPSNSTPSDYKTVAAQNQATSTLSNISGGLIPTQPPAPSVTPIIMPGNCQQYAIIEFPANGGELTSETKALIGTVEHPDLYSYRVDAQLLGNSPINESQLDISLRRQPQNLPENPIFHDQLALLSPLMNYPAGYYRLTLTIVHQNGSPLAACTITLHKESEP